jgi:hypothetical protein
MNKRTKSELAIPVKNKIKIENNILINASDCEASQIQ